MNPLVKLAASALPGEKKYILFAGAGVSKDAGIPTAWDLMLNTASLLYAAENETENTDVDLEKWFVESEYAEMEYSELMKEIFPHSPDQQDFLKKYLNNQRVGNAHKQIAEMARREIIRAIITTNFDHYIERAMEEKGLNIQVISTDEDLKNSEPLIHCKSVRIYKPHGDLGHGALKNTPKDLEKLSPLMEKELIRVISEHGIIVLGYSGRDKGIQKVFQERNYTYYPLFWINPSPPQDEIKDILQTKDYTYIPCTGAGQFIEDFLKLLERLKDLAPTPGLGPTISDLRYAFSSPHEPITPFYSEFLGNIFEDLERIRPDFSKFDEYDEAILAQINEGLLISYRFIEAALLASRYSSTDVIQIIYNFFGEGLVFYFPPDDFSGSYRETDFDGYRFLLYESFVSFIASLIKFNHWEIIGEILQNELFIERKYESEYVTFAYVSQYVRSLDDIRNKRLNLKQISIMADHIHERYTQSDLSLLINHKEFIEADYFLFMRTMSHKENLGDCSRIWWPRSCVYLNWIPSYLSKAESKSFLERLTHAVGLEKSEEFIQNFSSGHHIFTQAYFNPYKIDPIRNFNFGTLGTRR